MLGSRFEHKSKSVLVAAFVIILMLMILVVGLSYNRMSNNYLQLSSGFEKEYQLINSLIRLRQIAHERIVTTLLIVDEPDEINRFEKIEYFSELASKFLLIVDQIEASEISQRQKQAFREAMSSFSQRSAMLNEAMYLVEDDQITEARQLIHSQTRSLQAGLTQSIDDLIETFRTDIQQLFRQSRTRTESR